MKLQHLALVAIASTLGLAAATVTPYGFNLRPSSPAMAQNPCAADPCAAKNPCAANPCAANPCAANPCAANPCAANPCAAKNPCAANPCAAKNPCAANPCAANPCAANPCAANPCAAAQVEEADVQAAEMTDAEYSLAVEQIDGKSVIELTQTPCQFLESEGEDLDFSSSSAADCKRINSETAAQRMAQPLTIPAGEYTFRVSNQGVPYEVGFYLRGAGLGGLTLPKVSGGGLFEGDTQDYTVSLKPGEYVYSCPLNPTLRYPLTVTEG